MPHAVRADGLTNGRVIAASDTGAVTTKRAAITRAVDELSGSTAKCASGMPAKECAVAELRAFVDGLDSLGAAEQLDAVNSYVNRPRYVSDADNYGWRDYWAAPSALLTRGGDCEDYVLAKYAALRLLGIPNSAMRIFVAHHKPRRIAHAVLAVDIGGATYVLDNETDAMRSISGTSHLRPLFALNQGGYDAVPAFPNDRAVRSRCVGKRKGRPNQGFGGPFLVAGARNHRDLIISVLV